MMQSPSVPRPDFPISHVLDLVREAVAPYPPAVMYELAERGFTTLFQQVVACIVSVRTREEVTLPACLRMFEVATDAAAIARLTIPEIDRLITPSTFHLQKAERIREIAAAAAAAENGALPCSREDILELPGVGPKCANLALGIACDLPLIAVDIHVHRVTNRWGYVATATPERTLEALEHVLPEQFRVELNRLLVPFGKYLCVGVRPWCSRCPVRPHCWQVGVSNPR